MADSKNVTVTVKVADAVSDGEGGFVAKGAKIAVGKDTADELKQRGLAE